MQGRGQHEPLVRLDLHHNSCSCPRASQSRGWGPCSLGSIVLTTPTPQGLTRAGLISSQSSPCERGDNLPKPRYSSSSVSTFCELNHAIHRIKRVCSISHNFPTLSNRRFNRSFCLSTVALISDTPTVSVPGEWIRRISDGASRYRSGPGKHTTLLSHPLVRNRVVEIYPIPGSSLAFTFGSTIWQVGRRHVHPARMGAGDQPAE
jgi:hypothetical protein